MVESLLAAGFTPGEELRGGMAGYSVALTRDDCTVTLGGDRGDFEAWLEFPNPRQGRGHPAKVDMPAEDYVAAVRGDADASFLLSEAARRQAEVARWLASAVADDARLTLDAPLAHRVRSLQQERSKALFG